MNSIPTDQRFPYKDLPVFFAHRDKLSEELGISLNSVSKALRIFRKGMKILEIVPEATAKQYWRQKNGNTRRPHGWPRCYILHPLDASTPVNTGVKANHNAGYACKAEVGEVIRVR